MARKNNTMLYLVIAALAIGLVWYTGIIKSSTGFGYSIVPTNVSPISGPAAVTTDGTSNTGTANTSNVTVCDTSTIPVIEVIATEQFMPYNNITQGALDVNLFLAGSNLNYGSTHNGTDVGTTYGVAVPQGNDVYLWAGLDHSAATDYYAVKTVNFNVDCKATIGVPLKFAREGSISEYLENQAPNSSGNKVNGTSNIPDVNGTNTEYNIVWNVQENGTQACWGNPNTTKKVNVVMDYNVSDFQSIKLSWNGQQAGAGVIPPTITRDDNGSGQVSFTAPFLGVCDNAILSPSPVITLKTTSTHAWSPGYKKIRIHTNDYTIIYNTNTGLLEENVYDPTTGNDVGGTDTTQYFYYDGFN